MRADTLSDGAPRSLENRHKSFSWHFKLSDMGSMFSSASRASWVKKTLSTVTLKEHKSIVICNLLCRLYLRYLPSLHSLFTGAHFFHLLQFDAPLLQLAAELLQVLLQLRSQAGELLLWVGHLSQNALQTGAHVFSSALPLFPGREQPGLLSLQNLTAHRGCVVTCGGTAALHTGQALMPLVPRVYQPLKLKSTRNQNELPIMGCGLVMCTTRYQITV